MHITIFTANVRENDDLNTKLHSFCINSWDRLVKYFESMGHTAEIKIFTPKDKEMQDFYKLKNWKFKRLSIEANAFRLYMLANYENYLWLDWDIYIPKDINLIYKNNFDQNDYIFYRIFCVLYNANNKKLFQDIFYKYLNDDYCSNYSDQEVIRHFNLKTHYPKELSKMFIHLARLDNDRILPIEWVTKNNFKKLSYYGINSTKNTFCAKITFDEIDNSNHIIINCYNDTDLIDFIKTFKTKAL